MRARKRSVLSAALLAAALVSFTRPAGAVITITEIMYNPAGGNQALEYIEIHNETRDPMDITGYFFSQGVTFTFEERTFLDPGAYLVVCANKEAVKNAYGIENVAGNWSTDTTLDNAGEAIELANPAGVVEARVRYNDRGKWPSGADGTGHSLEIRDVYAEMDDPDSWVLSANLQGSPGKLNPPQAAPSPVLVNEALTRVGAGERWVELYNRSAAAVDLSGYHVTMVPGDLKAGTLPAGTMLEPGKWASFTDTQLGLDFEPDGEGRTFIALATPDGSRVLDARLFHPVKSDLSEARFPDGNDVFSEAAVPTRAAANRVDAPGDVVINEINYHPLDNDSGREFVEIHNRGTSPRDLTGWTFTDGIQFTFPPGTSLPATGFLVVARDPARIREIYSLPADKVLGPQSEEAIEAFGVLSDNGERLTLSDANGNIVDTVRWYDGGEWPRWADGGGSTMELIDPQQDNSVAQAWDSSDDSAKSAARRYSYRGFFTGGAEGEFHLLLTGAGITLIDDLKMAGQVTTLEPIATYIDFPETWKYLKGTAPPSDPLTAWTQLDFDDSSWASGAAIIGFGDGDETTILDDMQRNYTSFFVRKEFQVPDPAAIVSLVLDIEYDDGFAAYVNGVEVAAVNMRAGQRGHDTTAIGAREKAKEQIDLSAFKDSLRPGRNILAIQVHNATAASNDARFRASLLNGRFKTEEGPNLIRDGAFETDAARTAWVIQGNHYRSGRSVVNPLSGAGSLKVIATGDGDNKVNRLETSASGMTTPVARIEYEISFLARWIVGSPTVLTHGHYQGNAPPSYASSTRIDTPENLGTPGAVNSVTTRQIARTGAANLGPVIWRVRQTPVVPAPGAPVTVTARLADPDGVVEPTIHYSIEAPKPTGDPALFSLPLLDPDGDGVYTAEVPAQTARQKVVFFITATDGKGAAGRWPLDQVNRVHPLILDPQAPVIIDHLYGVYRHEAIPAGLRALSYRFWLHSANEAYLTQRPLHSNDMVDGSFIFENRDMYYNSKMRFSGSPFARQAWSESYRIRMPKDRPLHGAIESFNLEDHQGAGARDARERISHYLIRFNQGGTKVPYSLQYLAQWQANDRVNEIREHVQTPNNDFIGRWFENDDTGSFLEMDDRHVFNDGGTRESSMDGRVLYPPYGPATLGPDKEQYRYYFNLRLDEDLDDYSHFIELAKLMTPGVTPDAAFDTAVWDMVDVEAFCRTWAVRLNTDDWDQWSGTRGKNCYLYRSPGSGRWYLIPWDMELTYGNVSAFMPPNLSATSSPPYSSAFTEVTRFLNRPAIKRVFYAAMKDLIDGPFQSAFLIPYMQKLDGIGMQSTNHGKAGGFIDQRRARLRQAVTPVTSSAIDFIITTGGGAPLTVDTPTVVLEGKAPIEIAAIATTVNGVEADPPFVIEFGKGNLLNWKAEGPLSLGQNRLEFIGTTLGGDLVDSAAITVTVVPAAPPAIDLVTPATATAGEVLLIIGRNFRAGLKVFLGETELPLVAVEIGEPSRVEAQMPVGLPEGPTPLTILNPSGLRSDPFTVRVVAEKRRFIRGDADRSGIFDLTDVIFTLNYLFRGGVAPTCLDAADADDNGVLNLTDGIVALSALFEGGAPLPAPYPAVGSDVTEDPLDCALGIE